MKIKNCEEETRETPFNLVISVAVASLACQRVLPIWQMFGLSQTQQQADLSKVGENLGKSVSLVFFR